MSPNAATKGNALWKAGTEKEISMETSKALTKEVGNRSGVSEDPWRTGRAKEDDNGISWLDSDSI